MALSSHLNKKVGIATNFYSLLMWPLQESHYYILEIHNSIIPSQLIPNKKTPSKVPSKIKI